MAATNKELRVDLLTGRQVIVAADRANRPVHIERPQTAAASTQLPNGEQDPFLDGNEHDTPDERLSLRREGSSPNEPGWLLRVVANRYPAVDETAHNRHSAATGIYGVHDVVIECPDFRQHLTELTTEEIARVFYAWQIRLKHILSDSNVESVAIFRNEGLAAGASLPHCHSQILATNFVGTLTKKRQHLAESHIRQTGISLFDTWLTSELDSSSRIVANTNCILTVCPFASRMPFQTRFVPVGNTSLRFQDVSIAELIELADSIRRVAQIHGRTTGGSAFNLTLTLPPISSQDAFPWMLDFLPRCSGIAGFELQSDVDILTVAPETAAQLLREEYDRTIPKAEPETALTPSGYRWIDQEDSADDPDEMKS